MAKEIIPSKIIISLDDDGAPKKVICQYKTKDGVEIDGKFKTICVNDGLEINKLVALITASLDHVAAGEKIDGGFEMKKSIVGFLVMLMLCATPCFAAWDKTKPANNEKLIDTPAEIRANWDALEALTTAALQITDAKVAAAAGIVDTKLATISTPGKVSGAALTSLGSIPSGAGLVPLVNGGTNANITPANGGLIYSTASALGVTAAGSSGQIPRSGGAGAPSWSTATYPATAGTSGKVLISDGTNIVSSTPTYPNAAGTSGNVLTSDGTNFISSAPSSTGRFLGTQVLTSGTTYTPTATTTKVTLFMVAGGGGGGGAQNVNAAVAGGGGGGGWLIKTFGSVSGTYTYAIGAGGGGGDSGSDGTAGGDTTFINGGTTYTTKGGAGGIGQSGASSILSALGGAGGAVSTNGDVNGGGVPGGYSVRFSGTTGVSGFGASSPFGAGGNSRNSNGAGAGGIGFGSGGAGGCALSDSTNRAGGAGKGGLIIVYEYT